MNIKQKIKKYYFVLAIFLISLVIIFFYALNPCKKDSTNNDYYIKNKEIIYQIKDYVISNNLEGYGYINKYVPVFGEPDGNGLYNGKLGDSIKNISNNIYFKKLLNKIDVNYITFHDGYLKILTNMPIYSSDENLIFYSSGYYKRADELDLINGNEFHRIVKIFDNDWGIINGCYGCGGGGFD